MKIYGQDTGKGRNHDYDPAEERRQAKKPKKPKCKKPKGGQCPMCGRIVKEK